MALYQIIIAYDGTAFAGSQRQAHKRTVQGELERALRSLGWQGASILLAGRTDTGVHASAQVASAELAWAHAPDDLCRALNANLPPDLVVQAVRTAAPGFHPRFDALARSYRYRIYCRPWRDPLRERYAWHVWPALEIEILQAAAGLLVGSHDFAAFGTPPRPDGSTVRNVLHAGWRLEHDERIFEVEANAFLYRMARRMVFLQTAVAQGRLTLAELRQAVLDGAAGLPAGLAPACGLTLTGVRYPDMDDPGLQSTSLSSL